MSMLAYSWKEQPSPPSFVPQGSATSTDLDEYASSLFGLRASDAAPPPMNLRLLTAESTPNELGAGYVRVPMMIDVVHAPDVPSATADLATTNALETMFVFENRLQVAEFIERHRLRGLLFQARQPLRDSFGEDAIKILRLITDDEGSETLFCLVVIDSGLEQAQQRLRTFDEQWWLPRCALRAGLLNFDFELV